MSRQTIHLEDLLSRRVKDAAGQPAGGIEPATSSLGNQCSIQLSYAGLDFQRYLRAGETASLSVTLRRQVEGVPELRVSRGAADLLPAGGHDGYAFPLPLADDRDPGMV